MIRKDRIQTDDGWKDENSTWPPEPERHWWWWKELRPRCQQLKLMCFTRNTSDSGIYTITLTITKTRFTGELL